MKDGGGLGLIVMKKNEYLKKISTHLTLDVKCLILRHSPSFFLGGTRW